MTADLALTLSGLTLELVLVALLFGRRIHRILPAFVGFVGVALCTDAAACLVPRLIARHLYIDIWIASLLLESAFFLGLTSELGRNVLRHNRADSSPQWFLALALFVPAVWVLTLLSAWTIPPHLSFIWRLDLRLSQATAVLDLGAFLALVWWCALRRLHWPSREFRIAVGVGVEALTGLAAVIIHTHQSVGPSYHWVDVAASVVYVSVLIYWVQYFTFYDRVAVDLRSRTVQFASAGRENVHGNA